MTTTEYTSSSRRRRWHPLYLQIDPSDGYAYYTISDGTNILAQIVATDPTVTPPSSTGMAAGTEYWLITGNALDTFRYSTLYVTMVQGGSWSDVPSALDPPPFTATQASFSTPVGASWVDQATSVTCHQADGGDYGFDLNLYYDSGLGRWQGNMYFYRSSNDLIFKDISDGATVEFDVPPSAYTFDYSCEIPLP